MGRPEGAEERDHAAATDASAAAGSGEVERGQEIIRMREAQIDAGD
jgi:hypothetical protein